MNLRPVGDDGFNFFGPNVGSFWAEHRVERIGVPSWMRKMSWTRAARAVAILEQINTPQAVDVLKQLAAGHPDAHPTKAAKESIERMLPEIDPFGTREPGSFRLDPKTGEVVDRKRDYAHADAAEVLKLIITDWMTNPEVKDQPYGYLIDPDDENVERTKVKLERLLIDDRYAPRGL